MRVVCDIEANSLIKPSKIHLIVCKDIDTGQFHIFREVTNDSSVASSFLLFSKSVNTWIGHNFLGYDYPVLHDLLGLDIPNIASICTDTLIISKLVNYSREGGHSIERYGQEFSKDLEQSEGDLQKIKFNDWTKYSKEMEDYCVRDVEICHRIFSLYNGIVEDKSWLPSVKLEHEFQLVVNSLHTNGFCFDVLAADKLLEKVNRELSVLDKEIEKSFPPKPHLIREIHPVRTAHGTLHKKDFRWVNDGDLSEYNGGPFCRFSLLPFNPSSHKQIISVLNSAGWLPVDKTETHKQVIQERNRLKYLKNRDKSVDLAIEVCDNKILELQVTGWKVNENNLSTLPETAPAPARTLARRILLESRRRTLTEWIGLVGPDNRIHSQFYGLGAWTHRMAHQRPNTANIPTSSKLYGSEMRSLWRAPRNRLLVGVDAKGIQLRIFAHYVNNEEFTKEVISGDPHSLNQRILGEVCKTRDIAKRFLYALLLGAGVNKLAEILGTNRQEAENALANLLLRYEGLAYLKNEVIPSDARKGWFLGLDGRHVPIPGTTTGERKHLCMSGYLQNGEAIIMKKACVKWAKELGELYGRVDSLPMESGNTVGRRIYRDNVSIKIVNFVHDEWQTETPNNMEIALQVAEIQSRSLREVGEELGLRCPMDGNYWSKERNDYTIGTCWGVTH